MNPPTDPIFIFTDNLSVHRSLHDAAIYHEFRTTLIAYDQQGQVFEIPPFGATPIPLPENRKAELLRKLRLELIRLAIDRPDLLDHNKWELKRAPDHEVIRLAVRWFSRNPRRAQPSPMATRVPGLRATKLAYKLGMFGGAFGVVALGLALRLPSLLVACGAMACVIGFGVPLTRLEEAEDREKRREERKAGFAPKRRPAMVVRKVGDDAFKVKVGWSVGQAFIGFTTTLAGVKVPHALRQPGSIGLAVFNRNGRIVRLEAASPSEGRS